MKEIKAFIRPGRLDDVLHALHEHPSLPGVTVSEVRGFGRVVSQDNPGAASFGAVEMVKIECLVKDDAVDEVVGVIRDTAMTGRPGDGKIAVYPVESLLRIRTGATGDAAV